MKRDNAREILIQLLFSQKFNTVDIDKYLDEENMQLLSDECDLYKEKIDSNSLSYIKDVMASYNEHAQEVDSVISSNLKGWNINRISGTSRAILRCAVTEILYFDDIPNAASVNSAVEISKHYDDAETVSFINGVLGAIIKSRNNG